MSTSSRIFLISNLPSGGARNLYYTNLKELIKHFKVIEIFEPYTLSKFNLFTYLLKLYFNDYSWEKSIAKQINKNDICICYHSWLTKSPNIIKFLNCKSIYICHEPPREYYDNDHIKLQTIKERIINLLRKIIIVNDKENVKYFNKIIVNSNFSKKIVKNVYGRNSIVVYPGINNRFKKNITKIIHPEQGVNILTVGAINKLKNQLFISEIAKLLSKIIKVNLTLVANGIDKKYLNKIISSTKGIENLKLNIILNTTNYNLAKIYRSSDIFLYAPINEPFGMVVVEAMSFGLPIVAYSKGGGYNEIINDKNGAVIDTMTPETWVKNILTIVNDSKKLKMIRQNNLHVASNYTDTQMNKKLLSIINNL